MRTLLIMFFANVIPMLPKKPWTKRLVSKLLLRLFMGNVRKMLKVYYTYEGAVNYNDVAKILLADGMDKREIAIAHILCLENKLIEIAK